MKLREIRKGLSDLRAGDEAKLVEGVTEMKREQFNLRFQRATGQLDKPLRMRDVRRMVARAKTVLREKRPSQKV
jgi:large subunit ribosomal protein L29